MPTKRLDAKVEKLEDLIMKAIALRSLICICAIAVCALPLAADGPSTATIDGRVLDAQGQGLPGATVTLAGPQRTTTTMSDAEGRFRFALLQAGEFTVTAELEGLGAAELATTLNPGERRGVDLTLAGGTAEEITVTGEAPLVSKYETGSISSLQSEVIENVAFESRFYASTLRALPGVVNIAERDTRPAINGGIYTETQTLIDGVDTSNTRFGGTARVIMPATALSETRIEQMGYGAEYGRATGGIINSTVKTGSNNFHGDFLYIGQNPKWRAENQFQLERPDDQINSFETSLGGPILRQKAWFFAAYADMTENLPDQLASGEVVDNSRTSEPRILKLNYQPSDRHQLAGTWIDSRGESLANTSVTGDRAAITLRPLYAQVLTGSWSFAATSSTFIEVKVSEHKFLFPRTLKFPKDPATLCPECSDNPVDNNFRYRDRAQSNVRFNGVVSGQGIGHNTFPRDTAHGSATLFKGRNEIKFGIDIQDIAYENLGNPGKEYRGSNFCFECPGGFLRPQRKRVFLPSVASRTEGVVGSAYVQDRLDVGDRWSLHMGVRYDAETIDNDVGTQVHDTSDIAPRLTVVYDVKADGKLLVRGSVGRFYQIVGLDFAFREFSALPVGNQSYDEFNWNPATELYDRFRTSRRPAFETQTLFPVENPYKDQVAVGVDWQLAQNWVFKSSLVYHETDDVFFGNDQYMDNGTGIARLVQNWPGAFREYSGVSLELNRRFRGGWTFRSNLTVGDAEGNTDTTNSLESLFEGLGGLELPNQTVQDAGIAPGATDATARFRAGRMRHDIDRLNLIAMKQFQFGRQALTLGGFFAVSSGRYFGGTASTTVAHPVTGLEIDTETRVEPRDGQQLDGIYTLDFSAMWSFPIKGPVEGQLGFEVANITDEQEVLEIDTNTLQPVNALLAWQRPREFRLKVGIRF